MLFNSLLGAATLECCQHWWTHPRSAHARGGTEWNRIWDHNPHTSSTLFLAMESACYIATILNLHLQRSLEWLQQTSSVTSASLSQHSTPGRKPPSACLGAPPSNWVEDLLGPEGSESAIPGRCPQVRLHWSTPPTLSRSVTDPPHLLYWKLWTWPACPPVHRLKPPGVMQLACLMSCYNCKGRWMSPWSGCLQLRLPWTPTEGSWCRTPKSPHTKTRLRLPRPPKRQESDMQLQLGRWRPIMKLQSRKWKPMVQLKLKLWNNPMRKVYLS